jgi:hypothetical protein
MKESFYRLDCLRILELMAQIERRRNGMFHELYPELDEQCRKALDGEIHANFLINKLAKLCDQLNEESAE